MALGLAEYSSLLGINPTLLLFIAVWSLIWKGLALWKSATLRSKVWFVVILIFNTIGILPILYLFVFSKLGKKTKIEKVKTTKKTKNRKRKK